MLLTCKGHELTPLVVGSISYWIFKIKPFFSLFSNCPCTCANSLIHSIGLTILFSPRIPYVTTVMLGYTLTIFPKRLLTAERSALLNSRQRGQTTFDSEPVFISEIFVCYGPLKIKTEEGLPLIWCWNVHWVIKILRIYTKVSHMHKVIILSCKLLIIYHHVDWNSLPSSLTFIISDTLSNKRCLPHFLEALFARVWPLCQLFLLPRHTSNHIPWHPLYR